MARSDGPEVAMVECGDFRDVEALSDGADLTGIRQRDERFQVRTDVTPTTRASYALC